MGFFNIYAMAFDAYAGWLMRNETLSEPKSSVPFVLWQRIKLAAYKYDMATTYNKPLNKNARYLLRLYIHVKN